MLAKYFSSLLLLAGASCCVVGVFGLVRSGGEVTMSIADRSGLVANQVRDTQRISILVTNNTATRARIVGTNAC